ncbi:hypothetical protein B0T18DRAFT_427051 [Schizothecium vesticola]|uniref:Uncharacterized protein n=1 Tax=Schizothecium vesticola TaxID=314040 RepID=A0AA40KB92_9PEZI|nr:hypothetical protein B0T18DRAFT_427051 [Schizothecium vesticola]
MGQAANAQASTPEAAPRDNMFKADGLTIRVKENPSTKQHLAETLDRWAIPDGAQVSAKTKTYWDDFGGPPAWYATLTTRHAPLIFSVRPPSEQMYLDDDDTANTQAKDALRTVKLRGQTLATKLFASDNNANMPIGGKLSILEYASTACLAMHTDTACARTLGPLRFFYAGFGDDKPDDDKVSWPGISRVNDAHNIFTMAVHAWDHELADNIHAFELIQVDDKMNSCPLQDLAEALSETSSAPLHGSNPKKREAALSSELVHSIAVDCYDGGLNWAILSLDKTDGDCCEPGPDPRPTIKFTINRSPLLAFIVQEFIRWDEAKEKAVIMTNHPWMQA